MLVAGGGQTRMLASQGGVHVSAAPRSLRGRSVFQPRRITASGPSTTSYPEQIFQACAPATTNTIACSGSARITFPGGSVSTQTDSRTQYFSAMMYDIPVTAGAEKLSSRDGACSALGTGTALSTVSTTGGQSMTGGPSSAISPSSMSSSSSHGAAPTAEVMHLLRLGSLPAAILGAAVLL